MVAVVKIDSPVLLQFGQGSGAVRGPFESIRLVGAVISTHPEERPLAELDPVTHGWRAVGDKHLWREVFIGDAAGRTTAPRDVPSPQLRARDLVAESAERS